jgi:SAM-dependent methyltransferase
VVALLGASHRRRANLSAPITRTQFLAQFPSAGSVLELGPFDVPAMVGENVAYFDVLDQEGLRQRAAEHGRNPASGPFIDYVSENGSLSVVTRKFDAVFSSHVIEHQHDLVRHLDEVASIMRPGGSYFLVIPDKRYCLDHFLPETTFSDVLSVFEHGPETHIERAIHHVHYNLAHNDPLKHWIGLHGRRLTANQPRAAFQQDVEQYRSGRYRDIHALQFTPGSFLEILEQLHVTGRSRLKPVKVYDTRFGEPEFFAVLRLPD